MRVPLCINLFFWVTMNHFDLSQNKLNIGSLHKIKDYILKIESGFLLSMKPSKLFYFVKLTSPKSWLFMPCSLYLWKALDEHGCTNLVWVCLELECGSYWLLNHFLNENKIKSKLKIVFKFGPGCSWCCWKALH